MTTVAPDQIGTDRAGDEDFVSISVAALVPQERLEFDLYLYGEQGDRPVLYRGRNYPLTQGDVGRLVADKIRTLCTTVKEQSRYYAYLKEHVDEMLADETTTPVARFIILQEFAQVQLDEAFRTTDLDRTMLLVTNTGRRLALLFAGYDFEPYEIYRETRCDVTFLTHAFNVGVYATLLAQLMGARDEMQLERIAVGGMLHDYGMLTIPPRILQRRGALCPVEKELVQLHPRTGFELLRPRLDNDLNWAQLMMVYQHHEAVDGSGYPVGIRREEIHWLSRLCAVADVFSAMTCHRYHRRRHPLSHVLDHLEHLAGVRLESQMVHTWTEGLRSKSSS